MWLRRTSARRTSTVPTLADAKLGGARLDEGFDRATYTALVTTSDVTLSHRDDFRPRPMSRRNRRYRLLGIISMN